MILFITLMILSLIMIMLGLMLLVNKEVYLISMKIFNVGFFGDFELMVNMWNFLFLLMVIIISTSVMVFSISYMSGLWVNNFVLLYLSFIISMLWLVVNNNFYWMMFGWDGLGVVSFLLIVLYMNHESINNGLFTMFQNRIGDLFFVLFMVGMVDMMMSMNLVLKWGLLFLIIGGCVKSAQFPFNSWLPSAMSAPTPISSLVHSSTLVVAGVYILLQFSYCLMEFLDVLKYISLVSLVISGFGLLNELDMKKLIAYPTMSHVSLMMYLLSFQLFKVTYFHLNIHAMSKSLMFMCFGFVMLSSYHSQDKRLVMLLYINPLVKMIYYFSCLCMAGLPFLSAFFSKDFILEKFMEMNGEMFFSLMLMMFLSVSVYYSMKLLRLTEMMFSYTVIEKSYLGSGSVLIMMSIMIIIINLYVSMVFSLSLEIFSFKVSIYLLILFFFFLSIMSSMNYKFMDYEKIKSFREVWLVNYYNLDKFFFWNIFSSLEMISMMSNLKFILLMNWWVVIMVIVLF